jgi:bifunctional non-homologous end joining protein LigD
VVIPIVEEYTFHQTRGFVHQFGKHLASETDGIVSELSQSKEPGKVYIDYVQNSEGRTMISPYSLRAVPEAMVSTPIGWRELKGVNPVELNIFTVSEREKDPWKDFMKEKNRLEMR